MEYLSLNGMDQIFSQFVAKDPNLKQYGFGQLYNQNGEPKVTQLYPGLWSQLTTTTSTGLYQLNRTFQILIYDLVFVDQTTGISNQNKVVSDCEEFAFRLVRFLRNNSDAFDIGGDPIISPFNDKFLDDVSGVIVDITIITNNESSDCEDPDYTMNIKYNNI